MLTPGTPEQRGSYLPPEAPEDGKTVTFKKGRRQAPETPSVDRYVDAGESAVEHRAFLLYAMQATQSRSMRAAGRAVGRGGSTTRKWAETWAWLDRMRPYGDSIQARAIQTYRAEYLPKFALNEVAVVEPMMDAAFLTSSPPPEDGIGDAQRTVAKHAVEKGQALAEKRVPERKDPHAEAERVMRKGLQVIEGLIGRMGQLVADAAEGKKMAARTDLSKLLREYRETCQILGIIEAPVPVAGQALEPSYRVQLAQRRGESVIVAMYEDSQEVHAVLRSLAAAERVAAEAGAIVSSPAPELERPIETEAA